MHIHLALPAGATLAPAAFVVWVAAVVALSCAVASLAGFGGNLLALPLVAWACGELWPAVLLVLLLGTVQSLLMAVGTAHRVRWRLLAGLVLWSAAGLPAGLWLASRLPQRPLLMLMGLVILLGGLAGVAAEDPGCESRPLRPADWLLLLTAGVVHGAFGCGGPTVVLAARRALPEKDAFRATMFAFWIFLNGLALAGMGSRLSAPGLPLLVAIGLPAMLLGSWAGARLAQRVSQQRFGQLTAALLALTGLVTIARAW